MDTVNVHDAGIDTPKLKVTNRFNWDLHTFKGSLEECMNELKTGIEGILISIRSLKDLDRNQKKNKWDIMWKEFKYYDRLTRLETGISIDPMRNIISA
uniref:Uncharacterized protein n=1 Tax=Lactuca sativa TaxID=4236 RepID=A0A9R1VTV2_LACSA|nr:hypothetical protein LSAT_V11C400165170 [Lactuca sativa]